MKDCRECKSYQDCQGREWYRYSDIRFCPLQVLWILEHSTTLMAGRWPPSPDGSSYIDPKVKTGYGSEAYYAKPEEILGEVEYRLKRTGVHGKLLRAEVTAGIELSPESRSALMYVKGWRTKRQSYSQWRAENRRPKPIKNMGFR